MPPNRLRQNIAANFLALGTATLVQVASVPIFLFFWGKQEYGEWLVLCTIPTYVVLLDGGYGAFTANEAQILVSQNRNKEVRRSIHTLVGWLTLLCFFVFIGGTAIVISSPWEHLLKLTSITGLNGRTTAIFLMLYVAGTIFSGVFQSIYRAHDRNPRVVVFSNIARLAEFLVTVALLSTGFRHLGVAIGMAVTRWSFNCLMHIDSCQFATVARIGLSDFSWIEFRRITHPSFSYMAFPMGTAISIQGIILVVNQYLNASGVVEFNAMRMATRSIIQLISVFKNSGTPEFSRIWSTGHLKEARLLWIRLTVVTATLAILCSLFLFVTGPYIIGKWTVGAVIASRTTISIFLAVMIVNSIWAVACGLLMGINRLIRLGYVFTAASTLSLLSSYWLVPRFNVAGAALALLLLELIVAPFAIWDAWRVTQPNAKGWVN